MLGAGPLIAGHTKYTTPAFRQLKTCIFFAKFFRGIRAISLIQQSGSDFWRLAETGTLQSSPQMNTDFTDVQQRRQKIRILSPSLSTSSSLWLRDYVLYVERRPTAWIRLFHETISDSANSFRGLLGANVILPDVKNHAGNKLEGMSQH